LKRPQSASDLALAKSKNRPSWPVVLPSEAL
jgi:hypothetical protein